MSKTKARRPRMSHDAYAGFLRLLLTPLNQEPSPSKELDAYLKFLRDADCFGKDPEAGQDRAA